MNSCKGGCLYDFDDEGKISEYRCVKCGWGLSRGAALVTLNEHEILKERVKALEANTSKSVLRRIDAQLGVDDETE